jgi:hypothetical protein
MEELAKSLYNRADLKSTRGHARQVELCGYRPSIQLEGMLVGMRIPPEYVASLSLSGSWLRRNWCLYWVNVKTFGQYLCTST